MNKTLEEICLELIDENEKKTEMIDKLVKEIVILKAEISNKEDDVK